ncbi:Inorganic pyrophosphatase [Dubosiella muris]|uniref:Inorganic pyrophosphatase n=1 Tax=Dubosiella muris TaxID=3038133 RepID=A0AC61R7B7_9FIRM|nr:Inorganic pyrophosphatase [Dubosiella muris]TGY65760.1 Inorganic pyrophosphatase [Dubosiella muris]
MKALENNVYFWQKLDTLLLSCTCTIDRPKGSTHFKYSNLVYPVDYGFLADSVGSDQSPIDLFKGSGKANRVEAIAISADILKKDCEVKLLVGCTEQETEKILQFLNQTQFQKAILVRRGKEMPSWATSD